MKTIINKVIDHHPAVKFSEQSIKVLNTGRIIDPDETPESMISRVVRAISIEDRKYRIYDSSYEEQLRNLLLSKKAVFSTPIMTNAGRYTNKPLSACTVPVTSLENPKTRKRLSQEIKDLHIKGMGTGFNLDESEDPRSTLEYLNKVAVDSSKSGFEDRPVGNMAVLTIYHPRITEFISSKSDLNRNTNDWKFNISVNIDEQFMDALRNEEPIRLRDGGTASSGELFQQIAHSAKVCGDPGLIFLDRMNYRNPVPALGSYQTTAPCAEVGLVPGETCQFGYINLGAFADKYRSNKFDITGIVDATRLMTRSLDNCLDISIRNAQSNHSKRIMRAKRKIGVGLCGVADSLTKLGLRYDSHESRKLIKDILSIINYVSKVTSIELAEERGPCEAMLLKDGNKHLNKVPHLYKLYGNKQSNYVSKEDWLKISKVIKNSRNLRNISTVALPPTGRSALIIDASTGIEPHFSTNSNPSFRINSSETAENICLDGHVLMVAELQKFTDESISKTINLKSSSCSEDVKNAYLRCYELGLSGSTVYVDGSHTNQPLEL